MEVDIHLRTSGNQPEINLKMSGVRGQLSKVDGPVELRLLPLVTEWQIASSSNSKESLVRASGIFTANLVLIAIGTAKNEERPVGGV